MSSASWDISMYQFDHGLSKLQTHSFFLQASRWRWKHCVQWIFYTMASLNFFFANSIERVSRFMSRSVAAWKPWHRSTNSTKLDAHAWTFLLAPLPSNFNQRIHLPIFIVVIFLFLLARCLAAIFIFLLALRIGLITAMSFSSCFLLFLFKLRFFLIRL